jgi:3-hydroxyisobutyrate dehydrogenase
MEPTMISDTELKTTTIGFVGLGHMGGNMAARFLAGGYTVYGESRDREHAQDLEHEGLNWRGTPREVAHAADVVFTSVPDDGVLETVASGPDGILAGLSAGKIWVDVSTVGPRLSSELAERVRGRGATMLDAPVSGSVPQLQAGTLTIMVGGDLAISINLAVQMLAFSEGVLLAERGGLDRALAVEVMTGSAIGSPLLKGRAPLVLDLPEDAWFDVELAHKDIRLALATGRSEGVPLPLASVADEVFTQASELGDGHRDVAALFEVLSRLETHTEAELEW